MCDWMILKVPWAARLNEVIYLECFVTGQYCDWMKSSPCSPLLLEDTEGTQGFITGRSRKAVVLCDQR